MSTWKKSTAAIRAGLAERKIGPRGGIRSGGVSPWPSYGRRPPRPVDGYAAAGRQVEFPRPGLPIVRRVDGVAANPDVLAALIGILARCAWVAAGQPLCLIGDSGTGKSHLLTGLGTAAAENGYRVRYVTAAALVNELVEASDDRTLSKVIGRYGRFDLLCLDQLGYIELYRRGAELLFQCSPNGGESLHRGRVQRRVQQSAHVPANMCQVAA